jgi:hypothetical protein
MKETIKNWLIFFLGLFLIVFSVIFYPDDARASEWTNANTAKEIGYDILTIYDVQLTKRILAAIGGEENNPMLGNHPSNARLNIALAVSLLGHYFLSRHLDKYRDAFQDSTIVMEFGIDIHNRWIITEYHY